MATTLLRSCDVCGSRIPTSAPLVQFTASAIVRTSTGEEAFAQVKEPVEACGRTCALRAFQAVLDQAVKSGAARSETAAAARC